ncbi:MAG: GntR family transcriptional regulator [Synechococcales cyanobacterium T60_A2020_003]|nr:GntR family transcriptional regulator [Synechococcales cyanobacterium T60_A2020_003]
MVLPAQPLRRQKSLQEQAYQALRNAILSGELVPGQRLVETQLAEQLQVSRTPIREALRLLQHAKLAIADDSGAIRVTTVSVTDAIELYDCRLALESLSVTQACANATQEQIAELQALVEQAEKLSPTPKEQLRNYQLLDLDYRFHRLLAQSSSNSYLTSLLDHVFDRMLLLRIQTTLNNPNVLEIRLEHRQIYEAIAHRNPELAAAAIQDHLKASKDRVILELQSLHSDAQS